MGSMRASWRSLAFKLLLVLVIFIAVPGIIYGQFRVADEERANLLLRSVQQQGALIGRSLHPFLDRFEGQDAVVLRETLASLGEEDIRVRLLLRPRGTEGLDNFYFVAASQPLPPEQVERELEEFLAAEFLETLSGTCEGEQSLAVRYRNPAGIDEVLTSITPINTGSGCWAVITSHATGDLLGHSLGQPYWQTPEVRLAGLIYLFMALVVLAIFVGIWGSLRRFASHANRIGDGGEAGNSFTEINAVPELSGVAEQFDRMVSTLRQSARDIRHAAEENAHALKTPIAIIAQALEPLKRSVSREDTRARRSLEVIEQSLARLDALVSASRRMEEAMAELLNPPRRKIRLSEMLERMLAPYAEIDAAQRVRLVTAIEANVDLRASEDLIETVVENVLENAVSFSPLGGEVRVTLNRRGRMAILTIEDQGPGVDPRDLERIFERYYSHRSPRPGWAQSEPVKSSHFGIGLWVVRRNVEAIGGRVHAENRDEGGLRIVMELPIAS